MYEDGATVNFSMNAFNKGGRFIHIMGTKGELRGAMDSSKSPITLFDFETREMIEIPIKTGDGITNGHGGGDEGIVASWHEYLSGTYEGVSISDISTSVDNHLTVFAAEKSREDGIVVDVEEYKKILEEEGIIFEANGTIDLKKYGWRFEE